MSDIYRSIKIWKKTYRDLKLLSAILDESIVVILDRLVAEEKRKNDKNEPKAN